MCRTLEVSRGGFYAWRDRDKSPHELEDARLGQLIRGAYDDHRFVYGSPRIHRILRRAGETCGRKRVARIMRRLGLRSKATRRFRVKTTDSNHSHPIAPDLLRRNFTAPAPNRVWVSDITYIATDEGWLYLALTMDLFSRMIVGWSMGVTMEASLVQSALRMAVASPTIVDVSTDRVASIRAQYPFLDDIQQSAPATDMRATYGTQRSAQRTAEKGSAYGATYSA